MEKNTGYSTTTYKLRLYCQHKEWLWKTREMYNLILQFYYEILHYGWLGRRIIQYLRYKAFAKGIGIASVSHNKPA